MNKYLIALLIILGISTSVSIATPPVTSNYWQLRTNENIDDTIGVDARGNPYVDYGTACTITNGVPSAGCGLNELGQRDAMQFDYDSGGGVINRVGFFSDGRIAIDSTAPSDGSLSYKGAELEFDVEGAIGAQYYCNEDGLFCYTAEELRRDVVLVTDNASWPGSPANKDQIFNRAGRTLQVYDAAAHGGAGGWQPTYTKFMKYNAAGITALSPAPEVGDQVTSTDCDLIFTYNGTGWIDLANNVVDINTCELIVPYSVEGIAILNDGTLSTDNFDFDFQNASNTSCDAGSTSIDSGGSVSDFLTATQQILTNSTNCSGTVESVTFPTTSTASFEFSGDTEVDGQPLSQIIITTYQ